MHDRSDVHLTYFKPKKKSWPVFSFTKKNETPSKASIVSGTCSVSVALSWLYLSIGCFLWLPCWPKSLPHRWPKPRGRPQTSMVPARHDTTMWREGWMDSITCGFHVMDCFKAGKKHLQKIWQWDFFRKKNTRCVVFGFQVYIRF